MPSTYYVSTFGDDANNGTRDFPFATIDGIGDALMPGDTVYYLPGTYQNDTFGDLIWDGSDWVRDIWKDSSDTIIKLNDVHGTEANPIVIKPLYDGTVKFQYDGNGAIVLRDSSHIRIEGFEIEGPATSVTMDDALDAQWTYRIATSEDADGNPVYEYFERDPNEVLVETVNETIQSYEDAGIDQSGSGKPALFNSAAISLPKGSTHIEVVNNVIHDSAAHAISAHGGNDYITVTGNEIYNNTQHTSNGTHAVSFKGLDSFDENDGFKIIVTDNTFRDNYNTLVSWVGSKTTVTMEIDEGKSIHFQNAMDSVDPESGTMWDHGQMLVANNLIERAGNAAVTLNNVRGATVANNTIVDAGYLNTLLAQDDVVGSTWEGYFSGQGLVSGELASLGAIRLATSGDNTIANNLISLSDDTVFAVDASADATAITAVTNMFVGGRGLRIRAESDTTGPVSGGFEEIADAGFRDAAYGNYHIDPSSAAVNAGTNLSAVTTDLDGESRLGTVDVGVFESDESVDGYNRVRRPDVIDTGDPLLDELIDGLLMDSVYDAGGEITYTFDLTADIAFDDANSVLNQASIDRHLQVFADVTAYTGVTFTEVDALEQNADLYFSFRENTSTAYVYGYNGGVMHVYNPDRDTPIMGDYVDHLILHELGHGLGLEHAHDDHGHGDEEHGLPEAYQGHSWSVMSYRAHPDTNSLYYGTEHGPETFMLADIAALQYQFGANFEAQSDDTLYQVNFSTGELLINGESQGVPNNNKMQRAIWDGAGIDTLDLSNGEDHMTINLQPGSFTSFGERFLPDTTGEGVYFAEGNIANPYLYNGNLSSLIENAIGGGFRDLIIGNVLDNTLTGGNGEDGLYGLAGNDTLIGGRDNDLIIDGLGHTTATGGAGDDVVVALSGNGNLQGNGSNDVIIGGIGADNLSGGVGNDKIRGEGGRGLMFGDDVIIGGRDDDLLMGGRGADQFVFRPDDGNDVIAGFLVGDITTAASRDIDPSSVDFTVGVDTIKLSGFRDIDASNVMDFVTDGAQGAVFSAENTTVTVFGVSATTLSADDFVF